jgi:hypothetical protein
MDKLKKIMEWITLAPDFTDNGSTDILIGEVAQEGDHYWHPQTATWNPAIKGKWYPAICRFKEEKPKQPAFGGVHHCADCGQMNTQCNCGRN